MAALQDPVRRPTLPRDPLLEEFLTGVPVGNFELDKKDVQQKLEISPERRCRWSVGMTVELSRRRCLVVVVRTIAQQLGPAVEGATAPLQHALSTKASCECVSHVVQALTETDSKTTIASIDIVGFFDLIPREAMLDGLLHVDGGYAALPFVRLLYGRPSQHLWEDSTGTTHTVPPRRGRGSRGIP